MGSPWLPRIRKEGSTALLTADVQLGLSDKRTWVEGKFSRNIEVCKSSMIVLVFDVFYEWCGTLAPAQYAGSMIPVNAWRSELCLSSCDLTDPCEQSCRGLAVSSFFRMSALLRKRPSKVDQGSVCLSCLAKSFSSPHQYYANLYHKYCPFLSNPIRKAYLKESNGRRNFATVAVERREEEGTDEQFQPNLPKTAGRERNGKRTDSLEFRNFEVIKTSKSSTVSNTKSSKSKKPRKERHRQASKGFKKRLDRSSQKVELRIKVIERISHELNKISFSVRSEQPPKLLNSGSDRVDTTSTRVRMIRKRLITRTKVIERIARQLDLITSSARPTQTQKVLDSDPDKIHETSKQPHNVLEKTKSLSKNSREVPSGKKSRPPPKNDGSASTAQEGLGENRRSELIQRLESDIRALKKGLDAKAKAGRGPRILKVLTPKVESLKVFLRSLEG